MLRRSRAGYRGVGLGSLLALLLAGTAQAQTVGPSSTFASANITGGTITNTPISGSTGAFTTLSATGAITAAPTIAIGAGAFNSGYTATYGVTSGSGTMTTTNTLLVQSGYIWPFHYEACSDTATESGGSQSTPIGAICHEINMTGLGTGTGNRSGIDINMSISGTAAQTEGDAYFNGVVATITATSNLGGVLGTEVGDIYGVSTQTHLNSGATHYASVHGAGEWDLIVESGASVANKVGGEIALSAGDAVQGTNIDVGLLFTNRGSTGWNYGIELGLPSGEGGSFPVVSSGAILGSYQGGSAAQGIDFHNISFSGCAILTSASCMGNSTLGVGATTLISGASFQVHQATNENFTVLAKQNLADGIALSSLTDAPAHAGFEIQASTMRITADATFQVVAGGVLSATFSSTAVTLGGTLTVSGIATDSGAGGTFVCVKSGLLYVATAGVCT